MNHHEGYINLMVKPGLGYVADYGVELPDGEYKGGSGHFGKTLDDCLTNVRKTVEFGLLPKIELRSVQDFQDVCEQYQPLPEEDVELLVFMLNDGNEEGIFRTGEVKKWSAGDF